MLSNAYFLAKFHFDRAENEPAKILQNLNFPILLTLPPNPTLDSCSARPAGGPCAGAAFMTGGDGARVGHERSFSAVSKPNFARKYALESSRRDLHNALLCIAFAQLCNLKFFVNNYCLPKNSIFFAKFGKI